MLDISAPTLKQVAEILNTGFSGQDIGFSGVSIDSRTTKKNNLFIAIKGPNFDGHKFVKAAQAKGAAAALVSRRTQNLIPELEVADTKHALISMAQAWRLVVDIKFAGITGSNGKTTVKEMLASILQLTGPGLKTRGNLNNDFGVPLTLLSLKPEHKWAVVEMGASGPGEIGKLAKLVQPFVALINNIAPAHIEGFGSIREIAVTKGEIYKYLDKAGVAVMPYGSEFTDIWQEQSAVTNIITFGTAAKADISVSEKNNQTRIQTPKGVIELSLPVGGEHNRLNAAAATAIALQFDVSLGQIKQGLEAVKAVNGRLKENIHKTGARVIDDTYNANPVSVAAALKFLASFKGLKIFIFGDMGELGSKAKDFHRQIGQLASELGVDEFLSLGELSKFASLEFKGKSRHFSSMQELIEYTTAKLKNDTTILVKGSRFMQTQRLIESLLEESQ